MANTLSMISTITYIMGVVFLVLAIIFFIVFKIPTVVGDLSGRNARKSIELLRLNNMRNSTKVSSVDYTKDSNKKYINGQFVNKLTDNDVKVDETGLLGSSVYAKGSADDTVPLDGAEFNENGTMILNESSYDENVTTPLNGSTYEQGVTTPLNEMDSRYVKTAQINVMPYEDGATTPLKATAFDEGATTRLDKYNKKDDSDEMGTMPLNNDDFDEGTTQLTDNINRKNSKADIKRIRLIEEVILVHTNEVIV